MLRFSDSILNMESLALYESENSEFKDEARKLMVDFLGFEPELGASWQEELRLRLTLKRIQEGINTRQQLKKQVQALGGLTQARIKDLEKYRS